MMSPNIVLWSKRGYPASDPAEDEAIDEGIECIVFFMGPPVFFLGSGDQRKDTLDFAAGRVSFVFAMC